MLLTLGDLLAAKGLPFSRDVFMSEHTTLKVGGPAAYLVFARSAGDIAGAIAAAQDAGVPWQVIGNGSNLLVRDGGICGLVICVLDGMDDIRVEGTTLYAKAGARLSRVAAAAQNAGLSGLEAISGIPGAIGGALCMNAGSYGVEIAELVASVTVMEPSGQMHTISRDEMAFSYRSSLLMQNGWIATEVELTTSHGDPTAIRQAMQHYARQRRAKQPLSLPSAGSFFKRPAGHYAGALIESAGLKGATVGGAQVSPMHAGFFVNTGRATATDFIALMSMVQARVSQAHAVMLEPEVQIIGSDLTDGARPPEASIVLRGK